MKMRTKALLAAAVVTGIYSAVNGKGPFNKIRFKEQHERIANYVNTHHPGAFYTPISATKNGWVTVIRRIGLPKIILYVICDKNNNYIFTESTVKEK